MPAREITRYKVLKEWVSLQAAAKIYGEIVHGRPVTMRAIEHFCEQGKLKKVFTVSQHHIVINEDELRAFADKMKEDQRTRKLPAAPVAVRPTEEEVRRRLSAVPPPPR